MNDSLKPIKSIILLLLIIVFNSQPIFAQIFSWTDEQGRMHFSSSPPTNQTSKQIKLNINSYTSPTIDNSHFNTGKKVVMYSTQSCVYCKKAKQYFRKNNIAFKELDIERNSIARKQYKQMNGRGVPIILVGNKRLNGFSQRSFERIYNQ